MSSTISQAFVNALLADAVYAKDNGGIKNEQTGQVLEAVLSTRMTSTLAKYIADNFTVISVQDTPDAPFGSSFEGVVPPVSEYLSPQ